jgi:hypothetical protein
LTRVTPRLHKQALQAIPRLRIMDELRLEPRENFHSLRHREFLVSMLWMVRREGCLDLVSRLFDQGQAGGAWRQDRYFPLINTTTAVLVTTGPVEGNIHRTPLEGECSTHRWIPMVA